MLRVPARFLMMLPLVAALLAVGCRRSDDPRALLDRYFGTALRQDYAATYDCYYGAYRAKVSREDFVRRRREASVLQAYRILSLEQQGDTARAVAKLSFAPSAKLNRPVPVDTTVTEDLVREGGSWRIRVW